MIDLQSLRDARADAAREMPDRVTISRHSGFTLDPVTLVQTPVTVDLHTDVAAQVVRLSERSVQQAEQGTSLLRLAVHVPHGVSGDTGDTVTVLSSTDSDAVGRTFSVVDVSVGTFGVSRRLMVEQQTDGLNQFVPGERS
jgi:hypothetical protein